jgi:hypothetical protein
MLEKIEIVDRIEVIENGCVQVRTKTAIMEDARVQAICAATHTADVIASYKAAIATQGV